jgi:hypothetical protein
MLEPLSVDPRLTEERIRLAAAAPPKLVGRGKASAPPPHAGAWVRRFASSDELVKMLADDQPIWNATQCASALRVIRQGLLETDIFTPAAARDAFIAWAQPFWRIVIEHLGDVVRQLHPGDYAAAYGPHGQRLLWNRLQDETPVFTEPDPARDGLGHVVVVGPIPPAHDNTDKAQLAAFECLRAPLPLTELPSVERIHQIGARLAAEFPWAVKPIGAIVRDALARKLLGAQVMGGSNLLLVGPPGCGKTRLARRLAEEFEMGFLTLPMGGQSDPKIISGTSRGWAGGQPSPLITSMLTLRTANPLALIDEIDKALEAGPAQHGPAPLMQLLGLVEKENARRWRDLFLQAPCDVSKVLWVATANRITHLSSPLLDRFRVIELEAPKREHMPATLPHIAADIELEWGLPTGTLPALPESLIAPGVQSLRDLRLVALAFVQDWAIANMLPPRH